MEKDKKKDLLHEELVQSPGRTMLKNFFSRKLSVVGMCVFLFIFIGCFGLSFILPQDLTYMDSTRRNMPPALNYLQVPQELKNNAKDLEYGSTFGAGIDMQGKLYMWGQMTDKIKNGVPANMGALEMVACGFDHVVAVDVNGIVYAWGNDRLNITSIPENIQGKNIVKIAAGYQSTIALDDEGMLYFWGNQTSFAIKTGEQQGNYVDFALNITTAIAITKNGEVYCLAPSQTSFSYVPDSVQGHAVAVATTDQVGAALLDDGTVVTWGQEIAAEYKVPEEIQGRVVRIVGARTHFSAILDDGSVYSWGNNAFGQINYPTVSGFTKVAAAYYQNAAIDDDGKVITWGQKGYLLGTDGVGRDLFTRIIYGGRFSLTIGFVVVIISGVIGIIIGGFSGYYGGKVDMFLMRLAEVVSAIPELPLLMILTTVVSSRIPVTWRMLMVMVLLGLLRWPWLARLTRAQILSEKTNEFVTAAKAMGIRERIIIFKHILPNVLPVILVNLTLSMATCLLIESGLSFLGFGVQEPTPTWGNMLNSCVDATIVKNYWWRWVFPALTLGMTTISINMMGDGLRDAVDPKSNDR